MGQRAIETSDDPYIITLNPRFERRIDGIVEELAMIELEIRGPLEHAAGVLAELQDYLAFEVDKTELRLTKARAADEAKPSELEGGESWLRTLAILRDAFPQANVEASLTALSEAREAVQYALQGKEADHPEG